VKAHGSQIWEICVVVCVEPLRVISEKLHAPIDVECLTSLKTRVKKLMFGQCILNDEECLSITFREEDRHSIVLQVVVEGGASADALNHTTI